MSNINFSIQNPDSTPANQPDLYIGENNQLNFLFSNSLGIPTVNPGDVFSIQIPDNLITSAAADQLISDNWKVKQVYQQNNYFNYQLTPIKQLSFSGTITIGLAKLTGASSSNGEVRCNLVIEGNNINGPSTPLFVSDPPNGALEPLEKYVSPTPPFVNEEQEEIARGTVYTSPVVNDSGEVELVPPVANQIQLNLKFKGSELVKLPWGKTPKFMFSFSYGNEDIDLTNAIHASDKAHFNPYTSAWKIKAQIAPGQSDRWHLNPLNNDAATPLWIVEPTEDNPHLFTNDNPNLDIIFDHVITDLAAGSASIYIQWAHIPGYNPGRFVLDLKKQEPQPKIFSFSKSGSGFSPQDPVEMDWQTFAASELELLWSQEHNRRGLQSKRASTNSGNLTVDAYPKNGTPELIYKNNNRLVFNEQTVGYAIPPFQAQAVSYSCTLQIPGNPDTQHFLTLNLDADTPPVIKSFEVNFQSDGSEIKLVASWLVETDNVNAYCLLSGYDQPLPVAGVGNSAFSFEMPLLDGQIAASSYTLTVVGFTPEVSKTLNRKYQNIKTIKGAQIKAMSPNGNSAYVTKSESSSLIYFFDTKNIPETIDRVVQIGEISQGTIGINMHAGAKYAFASNIVYPTPDNRLYYFDPDNPPKQPQQYVAIEGLLGSANFSADNSRIFVLNYLSDHIAYFDPQSPPVSVTPQMQIAGNPGGGIGGILTNSSNSMAYMWYLPTGSDSDDDSDDTTIYYFDASDPPAVIDGSFVTVDLPSLVTSLDGKTMFVGSDKKVYHFPTETPPTDITTCPFVEIGYDIDSIFIAPSGRIFVSTFDKSMTLLYFDSNELPVKATKSIKMPLDNTDINDMCVSADGQLLFIVDVINNTFYYVSCSDPTEKMTIIDVGQGPFQIDTLPNGTRVFVSNSDNSISVLEVMYE